MKHRVLIVDDLPVNTAVLSSILEKNGYDTVSVHSGAEAVENAREGDFDSILLDIVMPGMDGFEVIRRLKSQPETAEIPVIFITGREGPESLAKGFELGAVDYITKPFNKLEVRARLKAHIKLYSTIKSLANAQADTLKQINEAQNSLLKRPEDMPEAYFSVYYEALHAAGGDIYDIIQISDDVYGYFVGDFAGHQISTSFLTSSVKALLHQNCTSYNTPIESMRIINSVLEKLMRIGQYMTACYAVIDRRKNTLTVISMGHPPLIFIPGIGNIREIGRGGDILGVFDQAVFRKYSVDMYPGDRILIYTDGLIEGERVWSAETGDLVKKVHEVRNISDKDELIRRLYTLTEDQRGPVDDDVMVLTADFPGQAPGITVSEEGGCRKYTFNAIRRLIDPCLHRIIEDLPDDPGRSFDIYSFKLVLYESLGNAVVHGCRENVAARVAVTICIEGAYLKIRIEDEGRGFDWKSHLKKQKEESRHYLLDSGRGIRIFEAYDYDFKYNDRGNVLYLSKKIED
ncbi:MAG: SpoIIE family protein phosphatase [Fibrobacterota bacterium]